VRRRIPPRKVHFTIGVNLEIQNRREASETLSYLQNLRASKQCTQKKISNNNQKDELTGDSARWHKKWGGTSAFLILAY